MAVDKVAMARLGFKPVDRTVRKRMLVNVTAPQFGGKTNFLLTAPGPIALFNFDNGLEGVVNKFEGKEVYLSDFFDSNPLAQANQATAKKKVEEFDRKYTSILQVPSVCSIGIDTETELWEVFRLAEFGKLAGNLPRYYEEVNKRFDRIVQLAYGTNKNLILLSKMRDEYVANPDKKEVRTGKQIFAGYKNVPYLVQVDLQLGRDTEGDFFATFLKCRQNPDIVGLSIFGPDVNFATVGTLVFPETSMEDWQ